MAAHTCRLYPAGLLFATKWRNSYEYLHRITAYTPQVHGGVVPGQIETKF